MQSLRVKGRYILQLFGAYRGPRNSFQDVYTKERKSTAWPRMIAAEVLPSVNILANSHVGPRNSLPCFIKKCV